MILKMGTSSPHRWNIFYSNLLIVQIQVNAHVIPKAVLWRIMEWWILMVTYDQEHKSMTVVMEQEIKTINSVEV